MLGVVNAAGVTPGELGMIGTFIAGVIAKLVHEKWFQRDEKKVVKAYDSVPASDRQLAATLIQQATALLEKEK